MRCHLFCWMSYPTGPAVHSAFLLFLPQAKHSKSHVNPFLGAPANVASSSCISYQQPALMFRVDVNVPLRIP